MARKIVVLHALRPDYEEQIRNTAPGWELVHGRGPDAWFSHLEEAEIILNWRHIAATEIFKPEAKLRWLQSWGVGIDRFPLEKFIERNIMLTTAAGVHPIPISETVMAMILAFARKIHQAVLHQREKRWGGIYPLTELRGKTIGIIGVGMIGSEIARLCKAFGMRVLGVKKNPEPLENVDRMAGPDELEFVLRESDYVIMTLPLTEETVHYMGYKQFHWMKPSAYYINIGRGRTTDKDALIEALQSGTIAGAGLDVFEVEPLPENNPLWEMDNVIITPHNSYMTEHYDDRAIRIFLQNLQDYVQGKEPSLNRVDFNRQY